MQTAVQHDVLTHWPADVADRLAQPETAPYMDQPHAYTGHLHFDAQPDAGLAEPESDLAELDGDFTELRCDHTEHHADNAELHADIGFRDPDLGADWYLHDERRAGDLRSVRLSADSRLQPGSYGRAGRMEPDLRLVADSVRD
jgi:hypothetical protein